MTLVHTHTHLRKKISICLTTEQRHEIQLGKSGQQKRIWEVNFYESQSTLNEEGSH